MVYVVWFLGALSTGLAAAMTLHTPKAKEKRKKLYYWGALLVMTISGLFVAIYQQSDQDIKDVWTDISANNLFRSNRDLTKANKELVTAIHKMGSEIVRAPSIEERFQKWINRISPGAWAEIREREALGMRTFKITIRDDDYPSLLDIVHDDSNGTLKCSDLNPSQEILTENGKIKNLAIYLDPSLFK